MMLHASLALPDEMLARAASAADAPAIASGFAACELAETGKAETIPEDVLGWWEDGDVCLETDTCLLTTKAGLVIGYSGIHQQSDAFMLDVHAHIHLAYRQRRLEHVLLRFVEERAAQMLQADPGLPHTIRALSFQAGWTDLLTHAGYEVLSSDWRMEMLLRAVPPPPSALEGIVVRLYLPGKEKPAIHAVVTEAFSDIGGHPTRSFEE